MTTAAELLQHDSRWTLDSERSHVRLRTKTMWGLATVKGAFSDVSGGGSVGADGAVHGDVHIAATSLDTNNARRDEHLRSADFFDVANHPEIVFTLETADVSAEGVTVTGQLTVRGTTRPLAFSGSLTDVSGDAATISATVVLDRTDFGLTWNRLGMIGGPTTVDVTARFIRQSD